MIAWSESKAEMTLYSLSCLLEEDKCRFRTQQLEFSQSKEILEMHMVLVHGCQDFKCGYCDRDTQNKFHKEIIEGDNDNVEKKADFSEFEEASQDITEQFDERKDSIALRNSTTEEEDSFPSEIADVTSVCDDREQDSKHFVEAKEATNDAVDEIFEPVGGEALTVLVPRCRNCGSSEHSSERRVRRRHCKAWNSYCKTCNKRGHFQGVCEATQDHTKEASLSPGELAALSFCLATVSKQLQPINKAKVPHMLHDQIQWAVSRPPSQPYIRV